METIIGLIATQITFNKHSIVYKVKPEKNIPLDRVLYKVVFCDNSIQQKDLILKSTMLTYEYMEVVFVPVNVLTTFYQKIYCEPNSKVAMEHRLEKRDIYGIGEVVAYVM